MIFNRNRVRTTGYFMQRSDIDFLSQEWKVFIEKIPRYPYYKYQGKGVVYTAGGISHVTCLWVSVNRLRDTGCDLPVEVWHLGNEISDSVIKSFAGLNVSFRNFYDIGPVLKTGFFLKPLAILHSSFQEVLYLDADNVCLHDPSYLFDLPDYQMTGTIFWPDYWLTDPKNPIWEIIGSSASDTSEQESGQLVVNKEICWKELNLCLHFNMMERHYYKLLYGDKDTFKFAWLALKTAYYMIPELPGSCGITIDETYYGNTIIQYDHQGEIIFLHRNLLKWDVTLPDERSWKMIKRFKNEPQVLEAFLKDFKNKLMLDIDGDVESLHVSEDVALLEQQCLRYLNDWRSSDTYFNFLEHMHFVNQRYSFDIPFSMNKQYGT